MCLAVNVAIAKKSYGPIRTVLEYLTDFCSKIEGEPSLFFGNDFNCIQFSQKLFLIVFSLTS
jgi:hypothetical protein